MHLSVKFGTLVIAAILVASCTQPKKVRIPTKLVEMSSPYSLHLDWQVQMDAFKYSDSEGLYFAENAEMIFFGVPSGELTAAWKTDKGRWTDQVKWQRKFNEPIISGPALYRQSLIVGTAKGSLMRLSQEDGGIEWQTELSSEVLSRAVLADGDIFVRTVDGKLYSVRAETGKINWVSEHPLPNLSLRGAAPVTYNDGTLYVGWESGKVEAIDAQTGEMKWQTQVVIPRGRTDLERLIDIQAELILNKGRLYVLAYHGKLVALNPDNGNLFWAKDVSGFREFLVDDMALYLVDEDDILRSFDLYNGTQLWKQENFKYRLLVDLHFYDSSQILLADGFGYVHWIDKIDGTPVARAAHIEKDLSGETIVRIWSNKHKVYLQDTHGFVSAYTVKPSDWYEFNHPDDPMGILKPQSSAVN